MFDHLVVKERVLVALVLVHQLLEAPFGELELRQAVGNVPPLLHVCINRAPLPG